VAYLHQNPVLAMFPSCIADCAVESSDRSLNEEILVAEVNSAHQFVEDVVVKRDCFTGAGALDVLDDVADRIIGAANRVLLNSPNDLFELLFPLGAVAWIREGHQFLDEIAE
jgi:hypothetical protein